jgi:hypothetical protein
MGIGGVELVEICKVKYEDATNRCWGTVFCIQYDGEIRP